MGSSNPIRIHSRHPLDAHRQGTRQVTIRCGRYPDPIKCQLETIDLNSESQYEALSYVWGSTSRTLEIILDDHRFKVTENLGIALGFLRSPYEDRVMWIDAICINQLDLNERASQVRMMGLIYSRATQVVAWLGEGAFGHICHIRATMDMLGDDYSIIQILSRSDLSTDYKLGYLRTIAKSIAEYCEGCSEDGALQLRVSGIEPPTQYWRRIWTVQEVLFARCLILQSKDVAVSEAKVKGFLLQCVRDFDSILESASHDVVNSDIRNALHTEIGPRFASAWQTLDSRHKTRTSFRGELHKSVLLNLLHAMRGQRIATDPRDYVYGLLGLSEPEIQSQINVRYDSSVKDVYVETFRAIVSHSSRLDVLCDSVLGAATPTHHLPSWVPDWSSSTCGYLRDIRVMEPEPEDRATGGSRASVDYWTDSSGRPVLTTSGFRVGVVTGSTKVMRGIRPDIFQDLWDIVLSYVNLLRIQGADLTVNSFLDTLLPIPSIATIGWDSFKSVLATILPIGVQAFIYEDPVARNGIREFCDIPELKPNMEMLKFMNYELSCFLIDPLHAHSLESTTQLLGLGTVVERGDIVCLFLGCAMPVVIRPQGELYQFVGSVRINAFRNGDAMEDLKDGLYTLERFDLV